MVAHELQLAGYRPPGIPAPVPLDERGEEGHETENGNDNDHDEDN